MDRVTDDGERLDSASAADAAADGPPDGAPHAADNGGRQPQAWRVEIGFTEDDLAILGVDDVQVRVSPPGLLHDEDFYPTEATGRTLRFARLPGHAELLVPHDTTVTVRDVGGDLRAERLQGALSIGRIEGDVVLADVADAQLGRVEGDLRASDGGRVEVREVGGDAQLEGLSAAAVLGRIGGDLKARGLHGCDVREAIGGDVVIEGCTGEVIIRGPVGGDLHVDGCAGTLRIGSVGGDLQVRLSGALAVDGAISGDCEVSEIAGAVELGGAVGGDLTASLLEALTISGAVGGDASIRTVAHAVTLRTLGGDLNAETIAGALTLQNAGGDVSLRTCLGEVTIGTLGGDITIQRATGGVAIGRTGGDAKLDTPLAAGAEYQVRAAGDIRLRVRGEVNARFVAQTQGGEIRTRLPLAVERGRRRNLVGVLGRGDAGVTLFSNGGDIVITAADSNEEETMGDEYVGGGTNEPRTGTGTATGPKSWEGSFGGHKFRVRWEPGAPGEESPDDPDAIGRPRRGFGFEWEHNPAGDRKAAEDFDRQMNELRERAEQVARRAAEQAQRYAERAARRARETDWEAIGREVRTAIERAMGDLEDTVGQFRRGPSEGAESGTRPTTAQRVRIERDDEGDAYAPGYGDDATAQTPPAARTDVDAQRRAILEELRAGTLSLDEAERRLGELR